MLSITMLALEKARTLAPELARLGDGAARDALIKLIRSGRREETVDFRTGDPQTLVDIGWGVALLKGENVITVLDEGGARSIRARAQSYQRTSRPALEPMTAAPGQFARYRVVGWPGVATIDVFADGTAQPRTEGAR